LRSTTSSRHRKSKDIPHDGTEGGTDFLMNRRLLERLDPLCTPMFVGALVVLLLNDNVLKAMYGNWWTGKLSDFVGLWAFGAFLVALTRWPRTSVAAGVAVAFLVWKSPLADPLIAFWNGWAWPNIGRTQDWSDLIALPVLLFLPGQPRVVVPMARLRPVATVGVALLAILSFVATQRKGDHVCCVGTWELEGNVNDAVKALERAGAEDVRHFNDSDRLGEWYSFTLPEEFCGKEIHANVKLNEHARGTTLTVNYLLYNCPTGNHAAVQSHFDALMARAAVKRTDTPP
jgi:hypothetical protein